MNLLDLRQRAELSQMMTARKLGVTQGAVSHWEMGMNPPLKKYRPTICIIYGCTEEELTAAIRETMRRKQ